MPSAFPPPASRTIDKTTARRFTLAHHHLWPPRKLNGKKGVIEYIRHIGSIQFDPINIVGRNPDLVLQARVKDYRPVMLDELLYKDQQLLDGWDKMASIYCLADWPNFARRRALMNKYHGDPDNIVMQVAPDVLGQIEEKGPLSPLDFKGYKKIEWSWGPTKASRASLEGLFEMGQLGVHHRVNNRRYFDLIERLISGELLAAPDPNQSDEHYQDWHILRRVGAMGLASSWLAPKAPQFGMLVAQKKYIELDHLFWKLTKIVFVLTFLAGLSIYVFVLGLNHFYVDLAARVLPPLPTALFLMAQCLMISSTTFSMYMRAHKQEPIMFLNVLGALLIVLLIFLLGKSYAAIGMAFAYLLVITTIVPLIAIIWYRLRQKWQREA